jgi:penicillin-binding protein 2
MVGLSSFDRASVDFSARVQIALGIVFVCFFTLLLRLWYLQVVNGEYYRYRSENNRLRQVFVPPPRGIIYDRRLRVLAKNRPSFNIELVTEDCPDVAGTLRRVAEILNVPEDQMQTALRSDRRRKPFEPKILLRDVDREVVAKIVARRAELPGIIVGILPARDYVHGELAAHLLGYIREISKHQLEDKRYARYLQGDLVGQYGLEAKFEEELQGTRGQQQVEVDARGNRISESSFDPEVSGHDLVLTVDVEVQAAAERAMGAQQGAVVALDPKTGAVRALVSKPAFDPNMFTSGVAAAQWQNLITGKEKRLSNRTVQGAFPPGSIFKIIMAVAGLMESVVTPQTTAFCPGFYAFGGRNYRCHKLSGHGTVDLYSALVQSCDVYFYQLGNRLGVDRIHQYATRFGLGKLTDFSLVAESPGLIPSTEWKRRYFKDKENQKWYPGETLSVAIGQGAVTVTPMQMAQALAALVNGGKLYRPYAVEKILGSEGRVLEEFAPFSREPMDLDPNVVKLVRNALVGVVNDPRGTGHKAKLHEPFSDIMVAGKTGTAQTVSAEHWGKAAHFEDHAWFVSYAPAEDPEIVVVVLVENGGHGGVAAAPIAGAVLEAYFAANQPVVYPAPPLASKAAPVKVPTTGGTNVD